MGACAVEPEDLARDCETCRQLLNDLHFINGHCSPELQARAVACARERWLEHLHCQHCHNTDNSKNTGNNDNNSNTK